MGKIINRVRIREAQAKAAASQKLYPGYELHKQRMSRPLWQRMDSAIWPWLRHRV